MASEPVYRIALFEGATDNYPSIAEITWEEILVELSKFQITECKDPTPDDAIRPREGTCLGHACPYKKIECWSPTDYADDCEARADVAVRGITLAVYDLDNAPLEQMAEVGAALDGVRYACHATHTLGSYRLVIPLVAPVAPADWPKVWQTIRTHYKLPADPKCANLSRVYFFPSKPWGRGEGEFYKGEGAPLDVAWLMDLYQSVPAATPRAEAAKVRPAPAPAEPDQPLSFDMVEIRKQLKAVRRADSADLLRKILDVEPLAAMGARDDTINRAMSVLSRAVTPPPTVDLAVEIVKPSISRMPCDPEGLAHWLEKARSSYDRALARRAVDDAKEASLNARTRGFLQRAARPSGTPESEASDLEDEGEPEAWAAQILRTEEDAIRNCTANAYLIFSEAPEFRNFLRFNELSKTIEVSGGPLLGVPPASLEVEACNWLQRSEFQVFLKPFEIGAQLLAVARRRPFNPLQDYLRACKAKWDGQKRLENFFFRYYGAQGNVDYLKAIGRRWLISCVARAMKPGSMVKTMLVLEGNQDASKSKSIRALGEPFYSNTKIDLSSRDGRMAASRFWLIEIQELDSIKMADMNTVKSFLSTDQDDLRLPYGKQIETFPRIGVLVGTTNEEDYLNDSTGNVRFWPLKTGKIDIEAIRNDRDQLWGEAVVAFEEGETWWFDPSEEHILEAARNETQARTEENEYFGLILDWMVQMPQHRRPKRVSMEDVLKGLQIPMDRAGRATRRGVGIALRQLGFEKCRQRIDTIPVWRYNVPQNVLDLTQEAKARPEFLTAVGRIINNQVKGDKT